MTNKEKGRAIDVTTLIGRRGQRPGPPTPLPSVAPCPAVALLLVLLSVQSVVSAPTASPAVIRVANVTTGNSGDGASAEADAAVADSYTAAANYTALECSKFDITYEQIERDLEVHKLMGTHLNATQYIARRLGHSLMRGMTLGFFGGRAHLLTPTNFSDLEHHRRLHMTYMRVLLHVEEVFGKHVPDVAFVLATSDTPHHCSLHVLNASSPRPLMPPEHQVLEDAERGQWFEPGPYPIMGIGKSDWWPDVLLVPNFHFHMKLYDNISLGSMSDSAATPWSQRQPVLFGRFSNFKMVRQPDDHTTYKTGEGGKVICGADNRTCPTRKHFIQELAVKDPDRLDVKLFEKVPMADHTQYKYLLNLDGQGISSRLEQLLPLGSAVFKEVTGYYAYYYKSLLKHRVNIIEFWKRVPEEVFDELDWAAAHDSEAEAIAREGVRTAATFLTANARTCYWYRLLHGLHGTLAYTPALSQWPEAQLLRDVLEKQLLVTEEGRKYHEKPWAP